MSPPTLAAISVLIGIGVVALTLAAILLLARFLERRDAPARHHGAGPDADDDDGSGGDGGPRPDDEPPWWPDFERQLSEYLASDRGAVSR